MEYRPIEVKLHCARDLKDVNVFSKMDVYVIGSVSGDPRSMQQTAVDKDGGTNPKWNHEMKFTFDESAARLNRLGLVFQIMSDRTLGDKEVGRVYVPLKELFEANGAGDGTTDEVINKEKHVVYQVQTPTGKFKGQLEFSFKLGEKYTQSIERKLEEPVLAYPAVDSNTGVGPSNAPGYGPTPNVGPTPKLEPSSFSGPSVGGAAPYNYGAAQPGYPSQGYGYGYGYGYGCGYGYSSQPMPPSYPNPHMGHGYGNGYPSGYGYAQQAPMGYMQQPAAQKPKMSKFGLGAAAGVGVGAGLLGGLMMGEMVEDMADAVTFDF